MKKNVFSKVAGLLILIFFLTNHASATDGYFSLGYGTKSKSLAGAGVALSSTSLIGGNPAGTVFLGKEFSVNVALFSPDRQYTISGNPSGPPAFGLTPGTVSSDKPVFFIPSVGGNWEIAENMGLGFSIYGNGGMNTQYPVKTFDNPQAPVTQPTGVNLSQLFTEVTFSIKVAENHALGVSGLIGYQMFKAEGLQAFMGMSSDATKLTNNDTDNAFGFGFKLGYLGHLTDDLSIGAKYQSKIAMSEFSDYAGLFPEQGDFDVPSSWTVGLAYQLTSELTIVADVKKINYSGVKSVSNPFSVTNPLGSDEGAGFGWEDMTIFKVGAELAPNDEWSFRAGYSFGEQPIPESEMLFNILAPGVSESHIAAGLSKNLSEKGNAINFSFTYSPANSISGPNGLDPAQTIELKMSQFEIELGYSF